MMVVYHGDVNADAVFDPARLSAAFGQVKYKDKADTTAEKAIRPIGLPRDITNPLPYLALLIELGSDSHFQSTGSNIKVTTPDPTEKDGVEEYYSEAAQYIRDYAADQTSKKRRIEKGAVPDPALGKKKLTNVDKKKLKDARLIMDRYNRYTIAIRGASPNVYGILRKAKIETEFETLLRTTMPPPTPQDIAIQHMRPLERLGEESVHNAWMSNYVARAGESEEHSMIVDS